MRLQLSTPTQFLVHEEEIAYLRAADATGAFGIQPHHADFITALEVSVLSWRRLDGSVHFVAVRGGVLAVAANSITIATPEAVTGNDLDILESTVLERMRAEVAAEKQARRVQLHLEIAAMRMLVQYLGPVAGGEHERHASP